jgi:ribosomal protein S18 acetylase RimI-like enzyme
MTDLVTIKRGLPEHLRQEATALYWQAFGGKLGRVMGPDPLAHDFLARVIRPDHALVALDDAGRLLGMAGFKTPHGSFAGGDWADMRAVYGVFGMVWRGLSMALLSREIDNDRFLLDGICVASGARGLGIGTALMAAIEDEAHARGYGYVRLDVISSNWRARALYDRLGFLAIKTQKLGPLRHLFGFDAAVTMVKPVNFQPRNGG